MNKIAALDVHKKVLIAVVADPSQAEMRFESDRFVSPVNGSAARVIS